MGSQDAAFLRSPTSISTTFRKNCGRGESLGTTTCFISVVGVTKDMLLPVKYFCSDKAFLCQSKLLKIIKLILK